MIPLPRPPLSLDPETLLWAEQLVRALQVTLQDLSQQAGSGWLASTAYTPTRGSFNATTATLAQTATAMATLIDDLRTRSLLG